MRLLIVLTLLFSGTLFATPPLARAVIQTNACCETSQFLIEKALNRLDGVKRCELDLVTRKVRIKYDPAKLDLATLRQAIAGTGFAADEVPPRPKAYAALPGCCKGDGKTCKKPE